MGGRTSRACWMTSLPSVRKPLAQLLPAPLMPLTKLSGLNRLPYVLLRHESSTLGSRSSSSARGTYLACRWSVS